MTESDWLGLSVAIFGAGFGVWAFYVRSAKGSLERMGDTLKDLVGIKIEHLEVCVGSIKDDTKDIRSRVGTITERIARLEERANAIERHTENNYASKSSDS